MCAATPRVPPRNRACAVRGTTRCPGASRANERFDLLDDLVDGAVRRVDLLRVRRGLHPLGIARVALLQVSRERVGADPGTVCHAALRADVAVGDEVDLDLRLRCDNGADVTPFDDD